MSTPLPTPLPTPLSICEPNQLHAMLLLATTTTPAIPNLVLIDAVSSDVMPTQTIPSAICVRMDAFDIYRYENDEAENSDTTASDSDGSTERKSSSKRREYDDPSDSGTRSSSVSASSAVSATPSQTSNLPVLTYGNFNLRPAQQLRAALEALQITATTRVVVFTQNFKTGVADPITAARLAWCLCYCGVEDVQLLNGGFGAWTKQNYETVQVSSVVNHTALLSPTAPRVSFGTTLFPARPDFLASTEEVLAIVNQEQLGVLADARSWDEYVGQMHGYNFDLGCGRIPGARWGHWGPSTYRGGDFSIADHIGKLQKTSKIESFWIEWGIILPAASTAENDRPIVFYCGSGWRSAMAWVMSQLLGLPNCKSYDGGFLEYNRLHPNAKNHVVESGVPLNLPKSELINKEEGKR